MLSYTLLEILEGNSWVHPWVSTAQHGSMVKAAQQQRPGPRVKLHGLQQQLTTVNGLVMFLLTPLSLNVLICKMGMKITFFR